MSGDLTATDHSWPDLVYDRDEVLALGVCAACWTIDGSLWEYQDGVFSVTAVVGNRRSRCVVDESEAPRGPWRHNPLCDCEACAGTSAQRATA
jgi:hypothetical protein